MTFIFGKGFKFEDESCSACTNFELSTNNSNAKSCVHCKRTNQFHYLQPVLHADGRYDSTKKLFCSIRNLRTLLLVNYSGKSIKIKNDIDTLSNISNTVIQSKVLISSEKLVSALHTFNTIIKAHSISDIVNNLSFKYVWNNI